MNADLSKELLSFEQAQEQMLAQVNPIKTVEHVSTLKALSRVLAQPLDACINVPGHDNSAMDGYAVRVEDLTAEGLVLPVSQRIPAGSVGEALQPGTVARIFTGAPLPSGANAVVMQERCQQVAENRVQINYVPKARENIRKAGEDIALGSRVVLAGERLGPAHLGLAASIGHAQLPVFAKMRVALFSTGSELAMPGEPLPPGGIYNSNRFMLHSLLEGLGCIVTDLGRIPDALDATRAALRQVSTGHDLILTSGGVSVGEEDHVRPAVEAEGALSMWKIAIKPGKPLAMGRVGEAAFIGLPGNPVAAWVTFLMLVRPFILRTQGVQNLTLAQMSLPAAFEWPKPDFRREFLRAQINSAGQVDIYPNQGSAVLSGAAWSHGFVDIMPNQIIEPGQMVRYLPYAGLLS